MLIGNPLSASQRTEVRLGMLLLTKQAACCSEYDLWMPHSNNNAIN